MPRLSNKGFISRAPQTGAAVQELPDFDPQLAEIPGGQETNASLQRWWDLIRQRIEFNNGSVDDRFQEFTRTIDGITGTITVTEEITSRMKDYLESRYTINVAAGAVLTGITIFSETGPDTDISYIAFQADRFFINTSSAGNKQIFSASATEVKFGDVLTVNLTAQRLYMGTGTYGNANTPFYVDPVAGGRMSLGSKFTWDGSTLTLTGTITATAGNIGGWTIGATTLTGGDATLNSAGVLVLGVSNNVVYLSAVDATYRLWIGNATAGSAVFRVKATGEMFASSGTIGGWTMSTTTLSGTNAILNSAGILIVGGATTNDVCYISAVDGTYRLWVGNVTAASAAFSVDKTGVMRATGGIFSGAITSTSGTIGGFTIGATTISASGISIDSATPQITVGSGATLTSISTTQFNYGNATHYFNIQVNAGLVQVTASDSSGNTFLFGDSADGGYFSCKSGGVGFLYWDPTALKLQFTNDSANLYRSASNTLKTDGSFVATAFSGSGAALTSLNASNVSSGTLSNSRLPTSMQLGNGTAGAPTYSFSSDTDTGWFWSASGDMRATTNGTERFVIRDGAVVLLVPLKFDTNQQTITSETLQKFITAVDQSGATIKIAIVA